MSTKYQVPRNLDVPDRIGIPFFTTVQFVVFLAGCALAWWSWSWPLDAYLKAWLLIYIPAAFFVAPRRLGSSGWTVFDLVRFRLARVLGRPLRTVWKP